MIVAPDFKQDPRHRATQAEWDTIRDEKAGPCRGCGGTFAWMQTYHHLVPRSLGGGDVEANIIPLCGDGTTGCHGFLENHPRTWERIAHNVRHSLTQAELGYILDTKGMDFLENYYPMGQPGDELCPRCRRPKSAGRLEKPRNRKSLVVKVPDDEQERGADLFEERLELCRVTLERDYDMVFGEGEATRYHILVAVMDVFSGIAG